jgi:gas vesicle protein
VGYMLVILFAPTKGKPLRQGVIQAYQRAHAAAKTASQKRRAELEAELARLRGERA